MKEKYNFKIDAVRGVVTIDVPLTIYPKSIILQAAYRFIEEGKVVLGDGDEIITVTLIPERKIGEAELEELAYEFNIQLISSFVENTESEKHSKTRDELMRAALFPSYPSTPKPSDSGEPKK